VARLWSSIDRSLKIAILGSMILEAANAKLLRYERWLVWVGIPVLSLLMHWRVWNLELTGPHVWRQTQTQQGIDAFVEEDFCILNPRRLERGDGDGIFRMEFPLFQWSVAAVAQVVGNSVLLSRVITFLISLLAMGGMRYLLKGLTEDKWVTLSGSFLFAFSPVIFYYSVSPLPDILAFACALWGCGFTVRLREKFDLRNTVGAAIGLGMASLIKLPYAMFYAVVGCWMLHVLWTNRAWKNVVLVAAIHGLFLVPAAAWYVTVVPTWVENDAVTGLFTKHVDYGLAWDILKDHLWQMIPRTLISIAAVPLLLIGLGIMIGGRKPVFVHPSQKWMISGFLASFLLYYLYEFLIISYYHDYYMQPLTMLLVIPAAVGATWLFRRSTWWSVGAVLVLLMLVPYMTHRRITPRWRPENAEFNQDLVVYQEALRTAVPDDALVVAGPDPSHNIFLYYIDKKGWSWDKNQVFDAEKLMTWRNRGAQYFYCDHRVYDENPAIQALLGQEIARFGTVRVYPLRQ
jgi:hypothetical protein